jgi:putative toxin-antitoxin system antitoxin component (TIGR02293 family)
LTALAKCHKICGILPKVLNLLARLEDLLEAEHLHGDADVVRLVEEGLPTGVVKRLRELGLTDEDIYAGVIPRRTLTHRIARRERLSRDESDRVVRILRVVAFGERMFGDRERFWRWFRAPKRRFAGRSPLQMLQTDAGGRVVEELLIGLDEGFVA